ncbi:MAG: phosphatidylserine/phosphatidylglycerophosphate/cardiolipin synthase family protein [Cyclobacteriaceae bacterium]
MQTKLLVDSHNFMAQLKEDMRQASSSVMVQAMTFEGDLAGSDLVAAMIQSNAKEKILLVDSYTRAVINDHFVVGTEYLRSKRFRNEVKDTKKLLKKAREAGIKVKFTNPLGLLMWKYPLRNHKKMICIDGKISYLGGINFSDHNFAWHDAMVRVVDDRIGQILSGDFIQTISGNNQSVELAEGDSGIYFFNGIKSKELYSKLFAHLSNARQSIDILSPYISDPLLSYIRNNVSKNVTTRIISPEENNKSIFKRYLNQELSKGYFHLYHYQGGMSHLKAILIDRTTLIMGSSNFDFVSYYFEQEVALVSRHKPLIREFMDKVLEVDLAASKRVKADSTEKTNVSGLLKSLNSLCHFASATFLKPK